MEQSGSQVVITGDDFCYTFDLVQGIFTGMNFRGKELLAGTPFFNIWRSPTDNDRNISQQWRKDGFDCAATKVYSSVATETEGSIAFTTEFSLCAVSRKPILHGTAIWTVRGDGHILLDVAVNVREGISFLPRFGLQIRMPEGYEQVEYFGYGPHESYIDKHVSTRKSRFAATVDEMHEDYLMPQENGSRYSTEWATVTGADGTGILIAGMDSFSFNISHYTPEDLTEAMHPYELKKRDETILHIDYKMSGLGSNSCGPELLLKYRLVETAFRFRVGIRPVVGHSGL
jgi:beta-galactosidase